MVGPGSGDQGKATLSTGTSPSCLWPAGQEEGLRRTWSWVELHPGVEAGQELWVLRTATAQHRGGKESMSQRSLSLFSISGRGSRDRIQGELKAGVLGEAGSGGQPPRAQSQ